MLSQRHPHWPFNHKHGLERPRDRRRRLAILEKKQEHYSKENNNRANAKHAAANLGLALPCTRVICPVIQRVTAVFACRTISRSCFSVRHRRGATVVVGDGKRRCDLASNPGLMLGRRILRLRCCATRA